MASRRLFILLTAGSLVSAACGGSAAQTDALKVQSENLAAHGQRWRRRRAAVTSPGDAGAAAAPADAGAPPRRPPTPAPARPAAAPARRRADRAPARRAAASARRPSRTPRPPAPASGSAAGSSGAKSNTPAAKSAAEAGPSSSPGAPTPGAPSSGGSAVGGATDVGVTGQSIKVGHIGIYSGPVGSFGDDLSYAGRAKLQEINDTGGINGRKLDVLVRDDAWDGTKGMNAARDLVEREKVFAFCCIMSVNTSDPLTPYLEEKKIPHIGADGWGEPQYKGAWTFPVSASAVTEAHMLAKYQAEKQGPSGSRSSTSTTRPAGPT